MIKTMDELLSEMKAKGYCVAGYWYRVHLYKEASAEVRELIKDYGCSMSKYQAALSEQNRHKAYLCGAVSMAATVGLINEMENDEILENLWKEDEENGTA